MSEMVERAAAAAYGHFFCDDWPPEQAPDLGMEADAWREAVRKAIAALREPSEEMVSAYEARCDALCVEGSLRPEDAWHVMVDAILTPGTLSKKGD